jgi:8-hydroxy-5-deazaflavin:NADPH oxidoreductase
MPGARPGLAIGMTTVGFIGSGPIGGYDVVLSNSRGPQTLKDLVEELGGACVGGHAGRRRDSG